MSSESTTIATKRAESFHWKLGSYNVIIHVKVWVSKGKGLLLVQSLKILLLADLKEDLHWVPVVINLCESREVPFDLIPISTVHLLFEILHIEEETWFLLEPFSTTKWGEMSTEEKLKTEGNIRRIRLQLSLNNPKKSFNINWLVNCLFEFLFVEELQDEEHQFPA